MYFRDGEAELGIRHFGGINFLHSEKPLLSKALGKYEDHALKWFTVVYVTIMHQESLNWNSNIWFTILCLPTKLTYFIQFWIHSNRQIWRRATLILISFMEIGSSVKGIDPMNTLTEMRAAACNYASQMKIKTTFHYMQCRRSSLSCKSDRYNFASSVDLLIYFCKMRH